MNRIGSGPVQDPSVAKVLAAIQEASSTALVVSLFNRASLRRARAVAGSASSASLNPYVVFAWIDQRRAAAGGAAVFLAASQPVLNWAPASAASSELTWMRSAAMMGSRSSHLVEKLLALNVISPGSISSRKV